MLYDNIWEKGVGEAEIITLSSLYYSGVREIDSFYTLSMILNS